MHAQYAKAKIAVQTPTCPLNPYQTCLERKNTELGYLSVKVLIKMEMPRIKSKSERGEIAQ